ncbi:hypothetical protein AOG23_24085 [Rhizobium acidisoli]|nr:hypothetical protein AOG23_24085 [Rhizobium acidisoli]
MIVILMRNDDLPGIALPGRIRFGNGSLSGNASNASTALTSNSVCDSNRLIDKVVKTWICNSQQASDR